MAQKFTSEFELGKNTLHKDDFANDAKCSQKGNKGFSTTQDSDRLRGRRPELPRYKPGMGLPTKNSPKLNASVDDDCPCNPDGEESMKYNANKAPPNKSPSNVSSEETEIPFDDCSDSFKRLKSRRPDKAVYIPKPKQANRLSSSTIDLDESTSTNCTYQSDSEWEGSHISSASERNTSNRSKSKRLHKSNHESQKLKGSLESNHISSEHSPKNHTGKGNPYQQLIKNGQCSGSQENPDNSGIHKLQQLEQFNKRNANHERPASRNVDNSDQNNKERSSKKKSKRNRRKSESKTVDETKTEAGKANDWSSSSLKFRNTNNTNNHQRNNNSGISSQPHALVNGVLSARSPDQLQKNLISPNQSCSDYSSVKEPDCNSNSAINSLNKVKSSPQSSEYTLRVPALTYEPSCKVGDWCDEVEKEEELSHSSIREKRKIKRPEKPIKKSNKDSTVHRPGPEVTDFREKSPFPNPAFHTEVVPPRFQRQSKETSHPFQTPDICDKPPNDVKTGGIIHLPIDSLTIHDKRNTPSPHFISRDRYNGRTSPETVPYISSKHLYEPKSLDNPSERVSSYMPRPMPTEGSHLYVPPVIPQSMPFVDQFPHRSCLPRPPCLYPGYNLNTAYSGLPPTQSPLTAISPFPSSFSDQLIHIDNQGKRIKPIVEKNITDAGLLERELNTYLSRGLDNVDIKALSHCRWKLQLRYENIILADPRFCADRNVENALWKSAFHQVIEAYRRLKEVQPHKEEEVNKAIINLVEEGTVFYESLLAKQQETFGLNLAQFLDFDTLRPQFPDSVKFILFSAQKIYICLGDLARYREQATNTTNYGKARSWYLKAQQIAPKNGRPYNQLAILALCARRKLDAVYFYMRSLAASNPFLSANESLLSLFDEARKKYEMVEKKRQEDRITAKNEMKAFQKEIVTDNRVEIWSHPKVCSSQYASGLKEESLKEMSTVDLNKRFVLSFLHVHGKLFTKVGMEDFTETANQMLQEFRCLLQRTPAPYTSVRLLQLLTINLFAVANTSLKDKSLGVDCRSLLQEQALQVSLTMMAIILERSTVLIQEQFNTPSPDGQSVSDDLAQLLPTIKIWTDWMACQRILWHPPPNYGELKTGCKGDVWMMYADFLSILKEIKLEYISTISEKREGYELVTLPEDSSLAGFVPLLGVPEKNSYVLSPFDKEKTRTYLRINCLRYFGDYLCGIQPPYLEFDVQKNCYISLVQAHSPESSESSPQSTAHNTSDEDSWPEDMGEDGEEELGRSCSDEDSEIKKLWSRKESLKRARRKQERHQAHIQELLRGDNTRMVVEVCPRIVVPDTNCFINHLDRMKLLMDTAVFQVYVPLIVINELDGLTRGSRDCEDDEVSRLSLASPSGGRFRGSPSSTSSSSSPSSSWRGPPLLQHSNHAMQSSRLAVDYLEQRFAEGDPKLRAVTAKGSLLDTISFRSEDVGDSKGTNDDLILTCCLHFCPDRASNYMPREPGKPLRLYREVVLLTEDRNLVVKAMSHNVPVKSVTQFLSWANIR